MFLIKHLSRILLGIGFISFFAIASSAQVPITRFEKALSLFYNDQLDEAASIFKEIQGCCEGQAKYYLARTMPDSMASESAFLLIEAAEMGSFMAMSDLATRHKHGNGVELDLLKSMDFKRASLEVQVEKWGRSQMSSFDEDGEEVDLVSVLQSKVNDGDATAMYGLAILFDSFAVEGKGVSEAALLYESAAVLGHKESQLMIGYLYCRGLGVGKNLDLANYWLNQYANGMKCK